MMNHRKTNLILFKIITNNINIEDGFIHNHCRG